MDFEIKNFSNRLTELLEDNNLTQIQLAKKIGISNVTISRYFTGERNPRIDVITKIASFFNVSVDYLLGLSDIKSIESSTNNRNLALESLVRKALNLDNSYNLSKEQIEATLKILSANQRFIMLIK